MKLEAARSIAKPRVLLPGNPSITAPIETIHTQAGSVGCLSFACHSGGDQSNGFGVLSVSMPHFKENYHEPG